jgi:holliday junction DNA helicase RuvB
MNQEVSQTDELNTNQPDFIEENHDTALRPRRLNEYIGQPTITKNLHLSITAAKQREEPVEHIIFSGPPGLGKTTLASIVAAELSVPIRITSGPALERSGDLASILASLTPGEVLFIDEIHRLNRTVEEMLYPVMEDFALDLVLGKGAGARTMRLTLPRFTLIGATTKPGNLSGPLRDRFGLNYHLEYYSEADLTNIIKRSAKLLDIKIDSDAAALLAERSRRTPRIANRLVKRVRDYASVHGDGIIHAQNVNQSLEDLGIDHIGLDPVDRRILTTIIKHYNGGPVGVETMAAATSIERATIEDVYEPYLLQLGYLQRTPRGRKVTQAGAQHVGMEVGLPLDI